MINYTTNINHNFLPVPQNLYRYHNIYTLTKNSYKLTNRNQ